MVFSNKLQTTDLIENLWATDGIITAAKLCTKAPNNMTFFLMIASLHPVIRLQVMKFIKTGNLRCGRSFLMHCCLTENITIDYNESLIPFIKLFMPQSQRRKSLCMYLLIKLFMKHHVQKEWLPSSVAWVYRLAIMKWSELIQDWQKEQLWKLEISEFLLAKLSNLVPSFREQWITSIMMRTQCQGKMEVMKQCSCCSRTMMWINHHKISSTMFQKTSRPQKMKERYSIYFHVS